MPRLPVPVPRALNAAASASGYGRFSPSGSFVPRASRMAGLGVTVDIDMGNTMSLGLRMQQHLRQRLIVRMKEAADVIVLRAKSKLVPGHGYDTGLMHDSLTAALVNASEDYIVAYDLGAGDSGTYGKGAYYWVFVEFGHMTMAGNWWPGYHFLSSTLLENESLVVAKVKQAIADTMDILAREAVKPR